MSMQQNRRQFSPGGGSSPPYREGASPQQPLRLPEGYLAQGYFDANGYIHPQVVVDWPRDIARKLNEAHLETSQLRKFFSEARHIEGQLNAGKEFAALRGRILKLDAYAADALKKNNAPPLFKQFIEQNLKWAADNKKSFLDGFIPHFENVVAYFRKNKK